MQICQHKRYLRFSINFSSKCFSHTWSLRSFIWRLKSASMTRFLVIWFTHCSRVFLDKSSSPVGILKILIPECLREVEHPKILQLAPGMTVNGHTKRKCFKKTGRPHTVLLLPTVGRQHTILVILVPRSLCRVMYSRRKSTFRLVT